MEVYSTNCEYDWHGLRAGLLTQMQWTEEGGTLSLGGGYEGYTKEMTYLNCFLKDE